MPADEAAGDHVEGLPPDDPRVIEHGKRAERVVAACFTFAFFAGCGFVAAYVGLGVHSVDKVLRSNLWLGVSLSLTLLSLGLGTVIWVRHLMPNVETTEERHDLRSDDKDRQAFDQYFRQGTANSQFVKRPLVRRTLMLGTLPLLAAPLVLLRDLGPQPGTSLRHHRVEPGPAAARPGHQPADHPGGVQRAGQHDHDRARRLRGRPGRADQGGRHPDQVPPG